MLSPALNRQEITFYGWGAALVLTIAISVTSVVWFALPTPEKFDLGAVEEFGADPAPRYAKNNTGQTILLWVKHVDNEWYVFDAHAGWNCLYKWVPTNNRFEDPCSGYKWSNTGRLLTYFHKPPPTQAQQLRDLDQYAMFIEAGHLWVKLDQMLRGEQRAEPLPAMQCHSYTYVPSVTVYDCAP